MRLIGTPRLSWRKYLGPWRILIPLLPDLGKKHTPYWTHPGCTVHHEREDTAARCTHGSSRGPLIRHN
jgi:hypothetical protein